MEVNTELTKLNINNFTVSVRLNIPKEYSNAMIIANGAGANMDSLFITSFSKNLAQAGIMTINFNFHYQEIGRKFPDANEKCQQTYIGVYNYLKGIVEENKIIVGGKSMGGRIATHIAPKINNRKIIVMGYPLHPPGKPNNLRDEHLYSITQKVLIIQGENDTFGNKAELDPVIEKMKDAHVLYIPFGNHSLKASKKSLLNNNDLEKKTLDYIVKFINASL